MKDLAAFRHGSVTGCPSDPTRRSTIAQKGRLLSIFTSMTLGFAGTQWETRMLKILTSALVMSLLASDHGNAQTRRLLLRCTWHVHQAEADGRLQSEGRRLARAQWQKQVRRHDGPRWSSYTQACDKNETCSGRWDLYRCFVTARPGRR
jgi:hypothetical protein